MNSSNANGSTKRSRFALVAAQGNPFKLVALVPLGSRLLRRATNGTPYWFAQPRGRRAIYVGSDSDKAVLEKAWATVEEKLREAEQRAEETPQGRHLRELQELVGGPALARTTAATEAPERITEARRAGGTRRPKR